MGLNKLEDNFKKDVYIEGEDIKDYLKFYENPEEYYTNVISDMVIKYKDYIKVSRFKNDKEVMKIKD